MKTDTQRDQGCHLQGGAFLSQAATPTSQSRQDERCGNHTEKHKSRSLERSSNQSRCLHGLTQRIGPKEDEETHRQTQEKIDPPAVYSPNERQPQESDEDGDDAGIETQQSERRQVPRIHRR
jgi:hypothetical protein